MAWACRRCVWVPTHGRKIVVLGYFKELDGKDAAVFSAVADAYDDAIFAVTNDEAYLPGQQDVADDDAAEVILYKKFDEPIVRYSDEISAESLRSFIEAHRLPLVTAFSQQSAPRIFGGSVRKHALLFATDEDTVAMAAFREAAAHFRGQVLFVFLDVDEPDSARVVDFFKVSLEHLPDVRLIDMSGASMVKHKLEADAVTAASVREFVDGILSGKLKPHLMSEEPVPYSGKGVRVIVGKEHDSVVNDPTKNVFVEYYAPWCGHCKQLAPIWEKLAKECEGISNVVIAKMDSTANEADSVNVQGFPTLKFYPATTDKPQMPYEGDRTLDELAEFLLNNSRGLTDESKSILQRLAQDDGSDDDDDDDSADGAEGADDEHDHQHRHHHQHGDAHGAEAHAHHGQRARGKGGKKKTKDEL